MRDMVSGDQAGPNQEPTSQQDNEDAHNDLVADPSETEFNDGLAGDRVNPNSDQAEDYEACNHGSGTKNSDVDDEMPRDEDQQGPSNNSEVLVLPLSVYALTSDTTTALDNGHTDAELHAMIGQVNQIWAQANIRFDLQVIQRLPAQGEDAFAELMDQGGRDAQVLRGLFDRSQLPSEGWSMVLVDDMGAMAPGVYFCDQQVLVSGRVFGRQSRQVPANVIAHELGHALGLDHACGEGENLMCADGMQPTLLWAQQISESRTQAMTGSAHRCQSR